MKKRGHRDAFAKEARQASETRSGLELSDEDGDSAGPGEGRSKKSLRGFIASQVRFRRKIRKDLSNET